MLARTFFLLSRYAQHSIRSSLGLDIKSDDEIGSGKLGLHNLHLDGSVSSASTSTNTLDTSEAEVRSPGLITSLDIMLPKVCEALVLVTQCMVTVAIEAEDNAVHMGLQEDDDPKTNMKNYFNEVRTSGIGIIESLIGECRVQSAFTDTTTLVLMAFSFVLFLEITG